MKPIYLTFWLTLLGLASCAHTNRETQELDQLFGQGQYEELARRLDQPAGTGEKNAARLAEQLRRRASIAERLVRDARTAAEFERLDEAENAYQRLLRIDPAHTAARNELEALKTRRLRDSKLGQAEEALGAGRVDEAERLVDAVLLSSPRHRKALRLAEQIARTQVRSDSPVPQSGPEFKKTVSLEIKEMPLKSALDVIWHATGINFILDRDVKTDQKASLFVHGVSAEEAIESLLLSQQLARKPVSPKTLFLYPRTPQKLAEHQELVIRNFFLAHADVKQIQTLLKSVLKIKEIFIDEKRNLLVIRDSPEQVRLADKLIQAHDQAEPEVMLALDVIEVRRTKLSELGLALPSQVSFGVANPLSLSALNSLGASGINVGFNGPAGANLIGTLNLQKTDSDANMLANPRIRVRNREKAKIHIGDRLPVVTTTSSSTSSFVGETVNYLDVGLKLEVEPQVMLEDHVVVKVNLEVSSATQSKVNAKFYDVGTRNTSTVLTIRDGETQVLAGLIRDDERDASSRLPGLGDIPVLGRLFSSQRREVDKTEIILAITPQVITNLTRPGAHLMEYPAGSESGGQVSAAAGANSPSGVLPTTAATSVTGRPAPASSTASASNSSPAPQSGAGVGVMPLIDFETPPTVGAPSPR